MKRRTFLQALAATIPASALAQQHGDTKSGKPVRLVVPYPPGGGADSIGRLIASTLSTELGATYYVENKGGAGGSIGATEVARAPEHSEILLLATTAIVAINPAIYRKLNYDVSRDFAPVACVCDAPLVAITSANSKFENMADFVRESRQHPETVFFASSGNGTIAHLGVAVLNEVSRAGFTHVPYGGEAAAVTAILAGQQQMAYYCTLATALPLIQAGKVRALGVPAPIRNRLLPQVPTLKEQGLENVDVSFWYGLLAPQRSRAAWRTSVERVLLDKLTDTSLVERLSRGGFIATPTDHQKFGQQIAEDIKKLTPLARALDITLD